MELANKTVFPFEPPRLVPADAAAVAYVTAAPFKETLADLARLSYIRARARYRVTLNQASATGAATLRLNAGAVELWAGALDLSAGLILTGAADVDLSTVAGQTPLAWELTIDTAADAGTVAEVVGQVAVELPLVIGSC